MPQVAIAPDLFTPPPDARLLVGRCAGCRERHFPTADFCPYCGSDRVVAERGGRSGTVYLHTVVQAAPPGYVGPVPYGFGLVDLDEGLRIISRLESRDLTRLSTGMPVRLVVGPLYRDDEGNEVLSWAYVPADEVAT